jgi:hypothetical protein
MNTNLTDTNMANFIGYKYKNSKRTDRAAMDYHVFYMVTACNSMNQSQGIGHHLNVLL